MTKLAMASPGEVKPRIDSPESARYADSVDKIFDSLPLFLEGQSKIIRRVEKSVLAVRLKPTIHSHTFKRTGEISGGEQLRLKASIILWQYLLDQGVSVAVCAASERCYICKEVDAPPVEVVVKAYHVGTPERLYQGMSGCRTRKGDGIKSGNSHSPYVRFDWRNPHPEKDECLPNELADYYIDTRKAKLLALRAFRILDAFFERRGAVLQDICFFIDSSGDCIFSEISPDCMRVKYRGCDIDKDLWRSGRNEHEVHEGWASFLNLIST